MNAHPITGNFNDAAWNLLVTSEANVSRVYSDNVGIPTLGVGYALITFEKVNGVKVYKIRGATTSPGDFTALNQELLAAGAITQPLSQLQKDILSTETVRG